MKTEEYWINRFAKYAHDPSDYMEDKKARKAKLNNAKELLQIANEYAEEYHRQHSKSAC